MTVHTTRAHFVAGMIEEYAKRVGASLDNQPLEAVAGEMIADMMHTMVAMSGNRVKTLNAARGGIEGFVRQSALTPSQLAAGDSGEPITVSIAIAHGHEMWLSATNLPGKVESANLGASFDL